ncbi:MAG: putative glycolipid-binding domain-containing protein [Planctomycetes bacterium]|nr:putative glycolipid-binding domain-containing protein [Planctomycetota bacterium]
MRLPSALLFALFLAGCGSDPQPTRPDEPHAGNFADVRTLFWTDQIGFGSAFVSERRCADGAFVTREHLQSCDSLDAETPAFWADVALETLPDGKSSRAFIEVGRGHEPAGSPVRLVLERGAAGRWTRARPGGSPEDLAAFDGCDDLEIEHDHATSTVAVRRLALKPGETKDLDRLLVRLPGADLERVKRRLTRLDETTYSWEGLGPDGAPAWRIDLTVDAAGTVTAFAAPGLQQRVVRDRVIR